MNKIVLLMVLSVLVAGIARGQVDVEHRRTLTVQTSVAFGHSEEPIGGFGAFWFNEDHFPWPETALRVFYAVVYADAELSWFLNENSAVGFGLGGGGYMDSIYPYAKGERLSHEEFDGDDVQARVFVNQSIPNPTPLPLNVRGTYGVCGSFFRPTSSTADFTLPDRFLTQTIQAELRFGGIEPGLTARRGAELYLSLDANYRNGFEAFGPTGALFPAHSTYDRAFGSIAGKIPIGPTMVALRVAGGLGEHLDELSAWKLGGNLIGIDAYALTLHGYYTREVFANDFGLANLELSHRFTETHQITGHLYGDFAVVKAFDARTGAVGDWQNLAGVGAGLGFRAFWDIDLLLSYGYGIDAVRNGRHGGHEIGFALERKF